LFSAPYAILACLADHRIDFGSFADEMVVREEIQSRMTLVNVVEREGPALNGEDIGAAPVTVVLRLKDGSIRARTVTASPGSSADPMTREQLLFKWVDCLGRANHRMSPASARSLFDRGMDIARARNIGDWLNDLKDVVAQETALAGAMGGERL